MIQKEYIWRNSSSSHVGLIRKENEDRMGEATFDNYRIYLIADGMGGHKGGAKAATMAIRLLLTSLMEKLPLGLSQPTIHRDAINNAIDAAFIRANTAVYKESRSDDRPEESGMGTTAVMLLIKDSDAYLANVGDSRAYLFSQGKLKQLTKDHSPVFKMFESGILTKEQARNHPQANIIDRAIGINPGVDVDIWGPFEIRKDEGILLCTDGLCGCVADHVIEETLCRTKNINQIAENLVALALKAGGEDNITVQFIRRVAYREDSWSKKLRNFLNKKRSICNIASW